MFENHEVVLEFCSLNVHFGNSVVAYDATFYACLVPESGSASIAMVPLSADYLTP